MKRSKWSVVVCIVALLGVTACSDSDEVVNLPVSQQAAAAIESAFVDVVLPLSDFVSGMADAIAAGQPKAPSLECPSSEGVCSSGSVTCDADSSGIGLDFDFDSCNLTEAMIVADGALNFTPTGASSFVVTLNGFSLDGGSPMSGALAYDGSECSEGWAVTTIDGVGILGTVYVCGDYPSSSSVLAISVIASPNFWQFTFDFDGGSTADVYVELNEELVSICETDLDTFETTCFDAGDV